MADSIIGGGPALASENLHSDAVTPADFKSLGQRQAGWIFNAIASIAATTNRLTVEAIDIGNDEHGAALLEALLMSVRDLSSQIGLLADIGATDTDSGMVMRGGSRRWLLPPMYHYESRKEGGQQ